VGGASRGKTYVKPPRMVTPLASTVGQLPPQVMAVPAVRSELQ
jgi:hypothetical protein